MTDTLPLPAAVEAEKMVLGAIMTDSECVDAALGNLTADDFSLEKHKRIFMRMIELHESGENIDRVTLAQKLEEQGQLKSVDGLSYLVSLDDGMPRLSGMDGWIGIIREKAISRRIIIVTNDLQARCRAGEDVQGILASIRALGDGLTAQNGRSFQTAADIVHEIGYDAFFTPPHGLGIETPFRWWSERMRFAKQSQTVLAAITGGGKTALALQCAMEAAKRNYRTAIYSLEMANTANLRRLVAQESSVNMHRLAIGVGTPDERAAAARGLGKVLDMEDMILFRDTPIDVAAIHNDLRRLISKGTPAHFVIVDHLLLVSGSGKSDNRAQEVSAISRGLKLTWKKFDVAGLVLSQFSRGGQEYEEPQLRWLKESSSTEQDADNVAFLWPRTAEDQDLDVRSWKFMLAKVRDGVTGRTDLSFEKRYTRFREN